MGAPSAVVVLDPRRFDPDGDRTDGVRAGSVKAQRDDISSPLGAASVNFRDKAGRQFPRQVRVGRMGPILFAAPDLQQCFIGTGPPPGPSTNAESNGTSGEA